jgi:hypothetical protein
MEASFGFQTWSPRFGVDVTSLSHEDAWPYSAPFYDAAWELCRVGVLRPGHYAPLGRAMGGEFKGDGYSLTAYGRAWVRDAANRPHLPTDPGRFAEVVTPFAARLGAGFLQRAIEASRDYRTANYLPCCAMAGAAAESILLALAIAKLGDEGQVLSGEVIVRTKQSFGDPDSTLTPHGYTPRTAASLKDVGLTDVIKDAIDEYVQRGG